MEGLVDDPETTMAENSLECVFAQHSALRQCVAPVVVAFSHCLAGLPLQGPTPPVGQVLKLWQVA